VVTVDHVETWPPVVRRRSGREAIHCAARPRRRPGRRDVARSCSKHLTAAGRPSLAAVPLQKGNDARRASNIQIVNGLSASGYNEISALLPIDTRCISIIVRYQVVFWEESPIKRAAIGRDNCSYLVKCEHRRLRAFCQLQSEKAVTQTFAALGSAGLLYHDA
jgi:hypothetical protein